MNPQNWSIYKSSCIQYTYLVGGFNPFEQILVKMGSSSPENRVKIPKIFELPPPSYYINMTSFAMFQLELWQPLSRGGRAPLQKAHGTRRTGPLRSLPVRRCRCRRHPLMSNILINSFGLGGFGCFQK